MFYVTEGGMWKDTQEKLPVKTSQERHRHRHHDRTVGSPIRVRRDVEGAIKLSLRGLERVGRWCQHGCLRWPPSPVSTGSFSCDISHRRG